MSTALTQIKQYINEDSVKRRLEDMLGKHAGAFSDSVITLVSGSAGLKKCTAQTIGASAMKAAAFNLPIDPALGFAAIVPYGNTAQFQLMAKGVTQLCVRTGQYKTMHTTEVYSEEFKSHNPITGETQFNDLETYVQRATGKIQDVVGFYAFFELLAGFKVSAYMTMDQVMAHAKKYSKSYQKDLREGTRESLWSTDPVSMGKKTVLKLLLERFGIMSVEMQTAFVADSQDFAGALEDADRNIKTDMGSQVVDAEFEPKDKQPQARTRQTAAAGARRPDWVQN